MKVSALYFYPVKSLRGIPLQQMDIDRTGASMDRRWMLVDENDRFITQRTHARMALVDTALSDEALEIRAPGMPALHVSRTLPAAAPVREVQVWRDRCDAVDAGDEAAEWFGAYLGGRYRLVFMPDETRREMDLAFSQPGDTVSFVDSCPFLLISTASLDDLNARLVSPVPMIRFRPSIVVDGCSAYAEDGWQRIRIGDLEFRIAKSCSRCNVPMIDVETAQSSPEPIRTLATYRRSSGKILFGRKFIHESHGQIRVGDPVELLA